MRLLRNLLIVVFGIALLFVVTQGNRVRVMYDSVHSIGERFGQSLPVGNDLSDEQTSRQIVRIEPASYYEVPDRLPASMRAQYAPAPRLEAIELERFVIVGVIVLCALLAYWVAFQSRREGERRHMLEFLTPMRPGMSVQGTMLLMALASVLGCGAFVFYRVFLTGVDDALIARSTQNGLASASTHITGNTTLSMSLPTLILLYIGLVLLLMPVLIALCSRCMGVPSAGRWRAMQIKANVSSYEPRWHHVTTGLAWCFYGLLTFSLLTAPWTTTMFGALWTS